MAVFQKVWAAFTKFVGPNTIHVLDALAAVAITGGVGIVSSAGFSDFAHKHPWATALVALGTVLGVPLAAKLRKAAGSTYATVAAVADTLAPLVHVPSVVHIHFNGPAAPTPKVVQAPVEAAVKPSPVPPSA